MQFLLDANVPRRLAEVIGAAGHDCVDVRDTSLASAADAVIAEHARREAQILVTRDFDFADVLAYPPEQHAGVIVIAAPVTFSVAAICALLQVFLADSERIVALPGRLAILEPGRVRLRPPL